MNAEQARCQVEALRTTVQAGDGLALLRAVAACARFGIPCPDWLAAQFCEAVDLVSDARVGTWNEAFGRPYPAFARIDVERQTRNLVVLVHRLVWDACIHRGAVVDLQLFEEISEMPGVNAGATKVREAYYRGLREGLPNVCGSLFYRSASPPQPKVRKRAE